MTPVLEIVGDCKRKLWGLAPDERLARAFGRASAKIDGSAEAGHAALLVGAEWVLHPTLAANLVQSPGVLLVDGDDRPRVVAIHLAGAADPARVARARALLTSGTLDRHEALGLDLTVRTPTELGSSFNNALRKRGDTAYALSLERTPLDDIEKRTFDQSYKGVTDFVTKWLWPYPARLVTRWAAEYRVRPNFVTTLSLVAVVAATYFFWRGEFVEGLIAAWIMAFLDTVDGKLARVTMTYSWWGNIYDHGIDQIHPPFWWAAWGAGVVYAGYDAFWPWVQPAINIILVGYLVFRLIEGIFLYAFSIQIHIWRSIDSVFRLVSARRNPNVVILTVSVLFGRPDVGLLLVAGWTIVSLAFHIVRLVQAWGFKARGRAVSSWLAEAQA